jgi:uncharacterized membrane protein YhaH (DUF805 family)
MRFLNPLEFMYAEIRTIPFIDNLYRGRLHRTNYILGMMSSFFILILFVFLMLPLVSKLPDLQAALFVVIFINLLLLFVLSLNMRRLHDFNRSGWWHLLLLVFPPSGLILMFCCLFVRGTNRENRHGVKPDKKIRYPHDILNLSK